MNGEIKIRKFTDQGVVQFRKYLSELKEDSTALPPYHLLTDGKTSVSMSGTPTLKQQLFKTRMEAARYFYEVLAEEDQDDIENDIHLWSWLSLFYFEQVCPADRQGRRKPGRDYRHIPEPGYLSGHRHLLSGAYLVYAVFDWGEELSGLLLNTPPYMENKFHHELASRQNFVTNRGIMEAAHHLYFNVSTQKPKRGALIRDNAPGTLSRFISVVQQLEVTYDLYSMTGEEVVGLLPPEFAEWK